MRVAKKSDRRNVPRWALWLVAVVCFGPLTLTWLLGVLFMPYWVRMIAIRLEQPERFADQVPIWDAAGPLCLVIGGFIGLIGLVRVLTLSRRERPQSHRFFTIGLVAVGLITLLTFLGLPDFSDVFSVAGLVYLVLPYAGAAGLLLASWKFLLAETSSQAKSRDFEEGGTRAR
jgi:hypothetical protein